MPRVKRVLNNLNRRATISWSLHATTVAGQNAINQFIANGGTSSGRGHIPMGQVANLGPSITVAERNALQAAGVQVRIVLINRALFDPGTQGDAYTPVGGATVDLIGLGFV